MVQWVLFKLYNPEMAVERRVLVNLDRVEIICQSADGTHFQFHMINGRTEKIDCTADELLLTTTAQVLAS